MDEVDAMLSGEPFAPTKTVGLTLAQRGGRGTEAREIVVKTSEPRIAVQHYHNNVKLSSHRPEL